MSSHKESVLDKQFCVSQLLFISVIIASVEIDMCEDMFKSWKFLIRVVEFDQLDETFFNVWMKHILKALLTIDRTPLENKIVYSTKFIQSQSLENVLCFCKTAADF